MVNPNAVDPSQPGGTRHYCLAEKLVGLGHEVTVIGSSIHYSIREDTHLSSGETYRIQDCDGVRFVWLKSIPYKSNSVGRVCSMLKFAHSVRRQLPKLGLGAPDVILGSVPDLFSAYAAQRLSRQMGAAFVLEVRDLWPSSLVEVAGLSNRHPLVMLMGRIERYLYRKAREIITLMPEGRLRIAECGVHDRNVTWIPNGVDTTNMSAPEYPGVHNPLTAMYAGAHGDANGLDAVLDAAALLLETPCAQSLRICLAGSGPAKARLAKRVEDEGLTNVSFEDAVPKSQMRDLYAKADMFIFVLRPLRLFEVYGVSPNKLYEYMAAARPIVFACSSGNNPVAEAQCGVSADPRSPQEITDALRTISEMSAEERAAMGARAREYAERNHSFDALARKAEAVFERAMNG